MGLPFKRKQNETSNEFYTGNTSKKLMVHVMQQGREVDKPVAMKIYDQKVTWNKRQYPIIPSRFYYDYEGVAHQQVDANDVAVLTFHKDHTDKCKKCGGKMTIDARQARELGKAGVFHAIWGIESTHMILMVVFAMVAMAGVGFGFYSYNEDTKHKAQLEFTQKELARVNAILNPEPEQNPNVNNGVR